MMAALLPSNQLGRKGLFTLLNVLFSYVFSWQAKQQSFTDCHLNILFLEWNTSPNKLCVCT